MTKFKILRVIRLLRLVKLVRILKGSRSDDAAFWISPVIVAPGYRKGLRGPIAVGLVANCRYVCDRNLCICCWGQDFCPLGAQDRRLLQRHVLTKVCIGHGVCGSLGKRDGVGCATGVVRVGGCCFVDMHDCQCHCRSPPGAAASGAVNVDGSTPRGLIVYRLVLLVCTRQLACLWRMVVDIEGSNDEPTNISWISGLSCHASFGRL